MKEIWKDIPGYEGMYKVSNLGRVKSLSREVWNGKNFHKSKEIILKPGINSCGYRGVVLHDKNPKSIKVSVLVAMAFLGHKPNKHIVVVDHINFIKTDDRLKNLRIVSNRENANHKHIPSSSKYVGVHKRKSCKKWIAKIYINGKSKHLGYFNNEIDAHHAYQNELKKIT